MIPKDSSTKETSFNVEIESKMPEVLSDVVS